MKEDFLHFVWHNKRFDISNLVSEQNQKIDIVRFGDYDQLAGPDFFNAQLYIDKQFWAGNIEMHLKASDWYVHRHEIDSNYDNVILHVVWDYDIDVYRKDGSVVPVLNLSKYVIAGLLKNYFNLRTVKRWIFCENNLDEIDSFTWSFWKEKLLIDRLENKSKPIFKLLEETQNNWNEVLLILLAKNFGLNINGNAFEQTAKNISFKVISKERKSAFQLEALFFGISGLLNSSKEDVYFKKLQKEYTFLKTKYQLNEINSEPIHFFKLRPDNFPTIRFSQLANLLCQKEHLFFDLIQQPTTPDKFYDYFTVSVSQYWQTHYVFDKESKFSIKKISSPFVDLLLLNTILPLRFVYLKTLGKTNFDTIFESYHTIKSESNSIINKFKSLNVNIENAFDSQSLIHLKKKYCDEKKCLQCMIGLQLLKKNV